MLYIQKEDFKREFDNAQREAVNGFADGTMYIEKIYRKAKTYRVPDIS